MPISFLAPIYSWMGGGLPQKVAENRRFFESIDDERLMATFLEYEPQQVVVNDMVFQRHDGKWEMRKSSYKKLRLAAQQFATSLYEIGFHDIQQSVERGFVTTIADA